MLELICDEELGYKRVVYRPKEAIKCANLCSNGDCLYMKLYAKANGVYMNLKCQFKHPNMDDCSDYEPIKNKEL